MPSFTSFITLTTKGRWFLQVPGGSILRQGFRNPAIWKLYREEWGRKWRSWTADWRILTTRTRAGERFPWWRSAYSLPWTIGWRTGCLCSHGGIQRVFWHIAVVGSVGKVVYYQIFYPDESSIREAQADRRRFLLQSEYWTRQQKMDMIPVLSLNLYWKKVSRGKSDRLWAMRWRMAAIRRLDAWRA